MSNFGFADVGVSDLTKSMSKSILGSDDSEPKSSLASSSSSSSSADKKKQNSLRKKTLKEIVSPIDDHTKCPKELKVPEDLLRDLKGIIANIMSLRCKAKNIFDSIVGLCNRNRGVDDYENKTRALRMILENAITEIERYVDKLVEIHLAVSQNSITRVCRVLRRIERMHCHGVLPMGNLLKDMGFVYSLVELINEKLNRPGDFSESSTLPQLFDGACCVNLDDECPTDKKTCEDTCSDLNEHIVRHVIAKHFNADNLDVHQPHTMTPGLKYLHSLVEEYNAYQCMIESFFNRQRLIAALNPNLNMNNLIRVLPPPPPPGGALRNARELHEPTYNAYIAAGNEFKIPPPSSYTPPGTQIQQVTDIMNNSRTYSTIRDQIFYHLTNLEKSLTYVNTKTPILIPCALYQRDITLHHNLKIYDSLLDVRKHIYAYIMNKIIAGQLQNDANAACQGYRNLFQANFANRNACLNNNNTNFRFNIIDTIFMKYFGVYLNAGGAPGGGPPGGGAPGGGPCLVGGILHPRGPPVAVAVPMGGGPVGPIAVAVPVGVGGVAPPPPVGLMPTLARLFGNV